MAYQHYKECKAVGQFPDDAVVRTNAGIISEIHEVTDKAEQYNSMARMGGLFSLMGGR